MSFAVNKVARQIMATYSLLFIDANEHIGRSRQIESPTDQQAVDRAAKEPGNLQGRSGLGGRPAYRSDR